MRQHLRRITAGPRARTSRFGALVVLTAVLIGAQACPRAAARRTPEGTQQLTAGNHRIDITHDGRSRNYLVHMPARAGGPLPVVLAFHGGGGNASGFQNYAQLDKVADREGFIVVYPNGSGPLPNRLLTWNAGDGCCGYALTNNIDDVGFAVAVVDDLARRTDVHRGRIYATGHSNGGILSHRIAAERADFVAAVAPVAGSLDLARFSPTLPVSVMQIHSVDDPRALYGGGLGPPFPGTNNRVQHQGVRSGLDRWIATDGCGTTPDTMETRRGRQGSREANHNAARIVWRNCSGNVEVAHWRLSGSGHGWPGNVAPAGGESLVGAQTTIILAAEEVWAFLKRFSR